MKKYHIVRTMTRILHDDGRVDKIQIDIQPNIVEDLEAKRKQVIDLLWNRYQGTINKDNISISFTYETIENMSL